MQEDIIIRKQKFRIVAASEAVALQVRRQLNDTLQYDVIAMLEQVFSSYNTAGRYINIDTIKVNVGAISSGKFDEDFIRLLAPELARAVQQQLSTQFETSATNASHPNTTSPASDTSAATAGISHQQQQLNALVYFLQHGVFPWWHKSAAETPATMLGSMADEEIDSLLMKLYGAIKAGAKQAIHNIAGRLFNNLPPNRFSMAIDRLTSLLNETSLNRNIQLLQHEADPLSRLFSITPQVYYTQLFNFVLQQNSSATGSISAFLQQLKTTFGLHPTQAKHNDVQNLSPRLAAMFNQIARQAANTSEKKEAQHNSQAETSSSQLDGHQKTTASASPLTEEGLFISNAGLVILHPFLQALFHVFNFLDQQHHFISSKAKYKATVVLYYLQSGSQAYQEWEMGLNKTLCNLPIEEVLPNNIVLTPQELEECNNLLQTVVKYWEALKGAGVEAMQQTFFLREGKLTFKQDHWLLQVERTGTDILLDRLPWGINTIKFPWLPNLIYTEW